MQHTYIFGDMRDEAVLRKALEGVEVIFHEAAAVGVGQSMYEIRRVGNEVPKTWQNWQTYSNKRR